MEKLNTLVNVGDNAMLFLLIGIVAIALVIVLIAVIVMLRKRG